MTGRWSLRALTVVLFSAVALAVAGSARPAHNYWTVWHNYLPDGTGDRSKHTAAYSGWYVRMSWTMNSHHMHFSFIFSNGSWYNINSGDASEWNPPSPFDRYLYYYGTDFAKAGCQNPAGLSTVWVNCRNAGS